MPRRATRQLPPRPARPACRRTPPADGSRRPRSGARRRVPAIRAWRPRRAALPAGRRATLVTTASASRSRLAGSRSRPAGSRRPLPIPRSSCTTISTSRASAGVTGRRPNVITSTSGCARSGWRPSRAGCETGALRRDQEGLVAECRRSQRRALSDARLGADLRAVASADHARIEAARASLDGGDHHGRLARAAYMTLPITTTGTGARCTGRRPSRYRARFRATARRSARQQQQAREPCCLRHWRAAAWRRIQGAHRAVWAAKLTRPMPASRAASMTLITDWCVACASALMTTSGSVLPAAAALAQRVDLGRRHVDQVPLSA